MSDEKQRIFTHPDIVQAGSYGRRYRADLMCSVCRCVWGKHIGWACPGGSCIESLPERPAIVSTTCARCSATIDPAAVEAHHAVCFQAGDYVRWERATNVRLWAEGEVLSIATDGKQCVLFVERTGDGWLVSPPRGEQRFDGPHWKTVNLRHIQRPGQAANEQRRWVHERNGILYFGDVKLTDKPLVTEQPTLSARLGHLKHGPGGSGLSGLCDADCRKCQVESEAEMSTRCTAIGCGLAGRCDRMGTEQYPCPLRPPPAPTLYDGLTAVHCLNSYSYGQRYDIHQPISAAQRAAASDLWSQQLRARISAAKESERLSVTYCEVDAEDEPW